MISRLLNVYVRQRSGPASSVHKSDPDKSREILFQFVRTHRSTDMESCNTGLASQAILDKIDKLRELNVKSIGLPQVSILYI